MNTRYFHRFNRGWSNPLPTSSPPIQLDRWSTIDRLVTNVTTLVGQLISFENLQEWSLTVQCVILQGWPPTVLQGQSLVSDGKVKFKLDLSKSL